MIEIKKCNKCHVYPNKITSDLYTTYKCPLCNCSSSFPINLGIEEAISSWNHYHGEEDKPNKQDNQLKLIRCKDCIYSWRDSLKERRCEIYGTYSTDPIVADDNFCSYGSTEHNKYMNKEIINNLEKYND